MHPLMMHPFMKKHNHLFQCFMKWYIHSRYIQSWRIITIYSNTIRLTTARCRVSRHIFNYPPFCAATSSANHFMSPPSTSGVEENRWPNCLLRFCHFCRSYKSIEARRRPDLSHRVRRNVCCVTLRLPTANHKPTYTLICSHDFFCLGLIVAAPILLRFVEVLLVKKFKLWVIVVSKLIQVLWSD